MKKKRYDYAPLSNRDGFTLLELMLVVIILSAIAFSTVSFFNNEDEQFRFEDTRTRIENIRKAVVGQPAQTLNGEPSVSGFVADIGRLPNSVQELIEPVALPAWTFGTSTGIWAGWRGPYLTSSTEQGGTKTFRDGWGNGGSAPDYGWNVGTTTTTLSVQSFSSDGAAGGTEYAADYPPSGSEIIVASDDHLLNLNGWTVTVTFVNNTSAPAGDTVRLRLYYPKDGGFSWQVWPSTAATRDAAVFISDAQTLPSIPIGVPTDVTFGSFGSGDNFVPWGVRSLIVVDELTGNSFKPPASGQKETVMLIPRLQLLDAITWTFE